MCTTLMTLVRWTLLIRKRPRKPSQREILGWSRIAYGPPIEMEVAEVVDDEEA